MDWNEHRWAYPQQHHHRDNKKGPQGPFLLAAAAALLLTAGCATGDRRPWSALDGRDGRPTDPDVEEIYILGMDGQLFPDYPQEKRMAPGFHFFELATVRRDRHGTLTRLPFALTAKPCVRYYVAAEHAQRLDNLRWQPRVLREEPISGCAAGAQ